MSDVRTIMFMDSSFLLEDIICSSPHHPPIESQFCPTGERVFVACEFASPGESLGPSNDADEAVQVEIRAAELATVESWFDMPMYEYESESYGALQFHNGGTPGDDDDGGSSWHATEEHVGWLARAIATHEADK